MRLALALLLAVTILPVAPAHAQSEADVARARQLFEEAQQAYAAGHFDVAGAKMEQAYELTRSPALAYNVARVYERMSEYDKAIEYFRIYRRRGGLSSEECASTRDRILALQDVQRRQQDQVFSAPPSSDELTQEARTFFVRGVTMFRGRHYEAAMQAFTAAHRFAPLPEIYFNMALTAERLGQLRDAIDFYREYLRVRPDAPDTGHVEREIARLRELRAQSR